MIRTYNSGTVHRYIFTYDESGNPFSMDLYTSATDTTPTTYYYLLNFQGDVIQLRTAAHNVVANYTYDAWGKVLSVTNAYGNEITTANHYALENPIRYRGYFYDTETKLYYCNSRYYDPQTRRFINADDEATLHATPGEFTDKNLFAYCDNNPVMRGDNGGQFWHILAGAVVGAVVNTVSKIVTNVATGEKWNSGVGVAAAAGALSGALASTGLGPVAQIAGNALISGAESFYSQCTDKEDGINWYAVASDSVVGGVLGASGGLSKGTSKHLMTAGKNTLGKGVKNVFKTGKYYFSQTKNMFYKPLLQNSWKDATKSAITSTSKFYAEKIAVKEYDRYFR